MNAVIIVAGGKGLRMGGVIPKQFLPIGGKPILMRTIERFLQYDASMQVVLVLPESQQDYWQTLCSEYNFSLPYVLANGGETRFHSVKNALAKVPDGAIVLIHDGVRPLISTDLIKRILETSAEERNVIPVTPVTDTLKALVPAGDGTLVASGDPDPDRSRLFGAQTPQLFLSEQIKKAYELGYSQSFTDDASVARAANIPLTYIEGERYNIKITTPEDLYLAEKLF